MTLPELSPEAKRAALKKAQEMRSKRARVREDLKQGSRLTLEEVLDSADDAVTIQNACILSAGILAQNRESKKP